jgi:hypothetical protein
MDTGGCTITTLIIFTTHPESTGIILISILLCLDMDIHTPVKDGTGIKNFFGNINYLTFGLNKENDRKNTNRLLFSLSSTNKC